MAKEADEAFEWISGHSRSDLSTPLGKGGQPVARLARYFVCAGGTLFRVGASRLLVLLAKSPLFSPSINSSLVVKTHNSNALAARKIPACGDFGHRFRTFDGSSPMSENPFTRDLGQESVRC
jgi:hypothetical protein